ncbi:PQQ-binding-like beta-propeller repeat protein [Streptomyces sp. NPDC049881]|uniref:outer membrane protein assembly factor BamB family protein n=1 Tax=Streptomyces sp. NPDC049881 TaxID=3155778 RepID=UPI00341E8B1D
MAQPTPPPEGSFGPPPRMDTPAGDTPGRPGYGYPRTPPAGYAYPPAPPDGYAVAGRETADGAFGPPVPPAPVTPHPPGPPGAPYGATPPPVTPVPAPGPRPEPGSGSGSGGGRRRDPARTVLVVTLVLAVLFAAGGLVWYLAGDGGGTPAAQPSGDDGQGGGDGETLPEEPITASLAWEVPAPEIPEEEIVVDARGVWFTDDTLVRLMHDALVAYDLETGAERWELPFELSGGACNASPTADAGRIAVLQGRDCEAVTVVDIEAGEEIVSIPLGEDAVDPGKWSYPALLGDTVAVGWGVGSGGYSVSDGERIWRSSLETQRCVEGSYAVIDGALVSQMICRDASGDEDGGAIRATDAAGDELWRWEYGTTYEDRPFSVEAVLSLDPLVVTADLDTDETGAGEEGILVVDDAREEIAVRLDYDDQRYVSPCRINALADCPLGVVLDGHLYLGTNVPYGDAAVVSFDLSTGQGEYEVPAVNGGGIRPFDSVDGRILAYQPGTQELEGLVVAIDPATEEASAVMGLDRAARVDEWEMMSGLFPVDRIPVWRDGTLMLLNQSFSAGAAGEGPPALLVYR